MGAACMPEAIHSSIPEVLPNLPNAKQELPHRAFQAYRPSGVTFWGSGPCGA